ncbi:flagellar protein FlgN [Campylobacter sp. RM10532]|uniref:flagellar protein FlgN n=1 Tax=Campylobacter TaxID=194 RepID=UPI001903D4A5|nr:MULTISPECIES: flagellar protein FlgN [unclassified Campylobacter]MBZ7932445.1 flagellar protein FlgN [Campylobacter sp. RM10543]MBZ7936465.1 flagellar protein FlgN [Campylobacter sp. B0100352/1]MBZ7938104.1 flagellar protein FlgN [Campylobacter sp. RM10538]MBZ7939555.1 flagellar protein FlgN [Campylobacter sp. W0014]MBZ7941296.1 flagellar protein FlgN [Campylobacter sp. W0047]MBZ7942080.1 flagellar protein FlgN [Campylobacter sp. W0045]MBZ7944080.1 flagellar protein FlgN [Campylobacter sp
MLKKHLDEVNAILEKLIALTQEDIENIKVAKHDTVAPSVEEKNKLISEFTTAKKQLDAALVALNNSSTKGLSELLDEEDKEKLDLLKKNLQTLHSANKEYAKFVLIIKDFFDGLVNKMFNLNDGTNNAYGDKKTTPESIFKINV